MTNLAVHPAARLEYEKATDWYAERDPTVAARFVSAVEAAIQEILNRPENYALVDEEHRLYLVHGFPYYVGYRYRPGLVQVVAIRHAAQDQDAWKGR